MQFKADMHMHTQYSDGRGTMKEMMAAGLNKGLDKIAITEHGPNNIGVGIKSAEQLLDIKKEALELSAGKISRCWLVSKPTLSVPMVK